jgi:hypothetical protein
LVAFHSQWYKINLTGSRCTKRHSFTRDFKKRKRNAFVSIAKRQLNWGYRRPQIFIDKVKGALLQGHSGLTLARCMLSIERQRNVNCHPKAHFCPVRHLQLNFVLGQKITLGLWRSANRNKVLSFAEPLPIARYVASD